MTKRAATMVVAVGLLTLSGCGYTVRYESEDIQPVVRAGQAPDLLVVDLIDGRGEQGDPRIGARPQSAFAYARDWPSPYYFRPNEWLDLTASFQEHVVRAGLAQAGSAFPAAPATVEEVEAIVERAAAEERAVAFFRLQRASIGGTAALGVLIVRALALLGGVGLAPLLISECLPVNEHLGYGEVELLVVDPTAGTVRTFVGAHSTNDFSVVGWTHFPQTQLAPLLKGSIAAAIEEAAPALRSGTGEARPFSPERVLRRVPEPGFYPPEGCDAYDPAREGIPYERPNQKFTNQPGATPPIDEASGQAASATQSAPAKEEAPPPPR